MANDVLAVYGQTKLKQNICKKCKDKFFIFSDIDRNSKYCPDCRCEYDESRKKEPIKTKIIYHIPLYGRQHIPKNIRFAVYERDNYICVYCDRNLHYDFINKTGKITLDHFIPYIGRGEDMIENLFTCCKRCNSAKYSQIFSSVEQVRNYIKEQKELPVEYDDEDLYE